MVGDPPSLSLSSSALYRGFFSSFHLFLNLYLSQTPRVTSFAVPPVRSVLPADTACPLSFVRSEPTERAHVSADCVDQPRAVGHLGAPAARMNALAATDGEVYVYLTSMDVW